MYGRRRPSAGDGRERRQTRFTGRTALPRRRRPASGQVVTGRAAATGPRKKIARWRAAGCGEGGCGGAQRPGSTARQTPRKRVNGEELELCAQKLDLTTTTSVVVVDCFLEAVVGGQLPCMLQDINTAQSRVPSPQARSRRLWEAIVEAVVLALPRSARCGMAPGRLPAASPHALLPSSTLLLADWMTRGPRLAGEAQS